MAGKLTIIALAISMLSAPAYAAQTRKKAPEPPPPPPQFRVDVATRSMSLARLALGFAQTAEIGKAGYNALFCGDSKPVHATDAFNGMPQSDYARAFATEAAAAGYKMAATQSDLFASGDTAAPELQLGAAIVSLSEEACPITQIILFTLNVHAVMKVEWQLFDPLEKKLLFRGTTEGMADVSKNVARDERVTPYYIQMLPEAARNAFQQAAKAIVADPNFVAAARDPRGGAPAQPQAGELFPEAQNAAPTTAPPVQIIRLPLSTKPFKDQVIQLRDQVVTVLTPGGQGSSFFVADGMLLTNHHVIAGYSHVRLRFYGGREIEGEVVASNARRDVALIKTTGAGVAGLPLRLEPPALTSTVFVIGTPARTSNEGSVISGIVSAFREEKQGPFIQSNVAVTHGNSGGPMFDDQGNVIGLTDLGDKEAAAVNLFIPIADALKVLDIRFAP